MSQKIFRNTALERLSTPERLDELIKVTHPRSWILLLAFALIIGTAIFWSIEGTIKTRVSGQGMLLGSGVFDVVPVSTGQITKLHIKTGDLIKEGDEVAEIAKPELQQQITEAQADLAELRVQYKQLSSFGSRDIELQSDLIEQQKTTLALEIATAQNNQQLLQKQVEIEAQLVEEGLSTRLQLDKYKQELDAAKNEIERLKSSQKRLSTRENTLEFGNEQQLTLSQQRINDQTRLIERLEEQYETQTKVLSPYSGKVLEILVDMGDVITPGVPMLRLDNLEQDEDDNQIRCILYLNSQDGKKVKKDMEVLIAPATIKPAEYGYMKGKVTFVSEYPSTPQAMQQVLKNEQLVKILTAGGAPFKVEVVLEKDPNTVSGFSWTSKGPPIEVNAGTPCIARITTLQQKPLALLIPALKQLFEN